MPARRSKSTSKGGKLTERGKLTMGMLEDFLNAHIDVATEAVEQAIDTAVGVVTGNTDDEESDD